MGTITDSRTRTIYDLIEATKYETYILGVPTLPRWRAKAIMTGLARQIQEALKGRVVIEIEEIPAEEHFQSIDWVVLKSGDEVINGTIHYTKRDSVDPAKIKAQIGFFSDHESDRAYYDTINAIVELYLGKPS